MVLRIRLTIFILSVFFWMFAFSGVVFAGQEEYRQCSPNELCEIGEFLFDDSYVPIATASCTLTSRNPSGNLYLDEVVMQVEADGWYSYEVTTAGQDYGLYRSKICCSHEVEYLCLDKSFVIATPSAGLTESQVAGAVWDADPASHNTADTFGENLQDPSSLSVADVWSYPQRSLTSFGTLTADIWSYSSRSLNNISSMVSSIWSNSERTITDADLDDGELATKSQVETVNTGIGNIDDVSDELTALSQEVQTNRYFLEQLVNAPIIETFIEEGAATPGDLQAKIQETKKIARFLSSDATDLTKQIIALNTTWEDTSYQLALSEMTTASRVLGASTQDPTGPDSISTRIAWLGQKWDSPIMNNLSTQATSALANVNSISREVKSYGKTFISKQYLDIASEHAGKLKLVIGEEGDLADSNTLFGYIANIEMIADILVQQSLDLDELIKYWHEYTDGEKDIKLARIKRNVLEVNNIIEAESLLKARVSDSQHRENLALALRGVINSNLIFLAQDSEQVLQNIWLEHGSVIFRSLVTNPSSTIAQTVNVKYYLPQEIGLEHIIEIEDSLTAVFDAEKNALYISGEVSLQPEETKTFVVEVADVWVISEEEIASIRKQTETLFESLRNTSYFAQGSTIKADIEVNLDKIALLQKNNQTPEMKIKSHREAMLELQAAQSKLTDLKTIVSSAGSVGTLFGFVGGVQAIAVWGLIIILIAGFVFLFIYLKMIAGKSLDQPSKEVTSTKKKDNKKSKTKEVSLEKLVAKNKDLSTWELLKEIISMKLNLSKKSSESFKNKKIVWLGVVVFGLVILVFVLLILLSQKDKPKANMVSPLPISDSQVETYKQNLLEKKQLAEADSTELNNRVENGTVLGSKTKNIKIEEAGNLADYDGELVLKEYLAKASVPAGYQAINVRVEPSIDAEIVSRLWVNQKVYVSHKQDGWVLIKTNPVDKTEVIRGWIVEDFISELE